LEFKPWLFSQGRRAAREARVSTLGRGKLFHAIHHILEFSIDPETNELFLFPEWSLYALALDV
jgi:hypothetical protein